MFRHKYNDVMSLPSDIVEANSVNSFKNKVDKYFGVQDIYFNYKSDLA